MTLSQGRKYISRFLFKVITRNDKLKRNDDRYDRKSLVSHMVLLVVVPWFQVKKQFH